MPTFNPTKDITDLSGKVILITGGTAGLGTETLKQLAAHNPAELYFTGRNAKAAADIISGLKSSAPNVKVSFIELDLLSLSSIKAAQPKLPSERLDVVICNAGIMARPPALSKDGYEIQFATNHLAHALLIKYCLPTLLRTADTFPGANARIVILTSLGFRGHPKGGIVFKDLKTVQDLGAFGSWQRYGQSKLANILYASELARRYGDRGLTSVSVHPGIINTGLVDGLSFGNKAFVRMAAVGRMVKPNEGAWNTLWAATREKGVVRNGGFYEPVGLDCTDKRLDKLAKDAGLARQLWEWTEGELKEY